MRFIQVSLPALFLSLMACGGGDASSAPPATPASTSASQPAPALVAASGKPDSDKATWKDDPSGKSCHVKSSGSDLVGSVDAMVKACVDTSKMKQIGTATTGASSGSADTMVKTIPLAAKSGHCYRVLGFAEPSVTDFDIAIMDSSGKSAGEDGTDSNDAVVREKGPICFTTDDNVNVNAAVASGKGKWALEIWSD